MFGQWDSWGQRGNGRGGGLPEGTDRVMEFEEAVGEEWAWVEAEYSASAPGSLRRREVLRRLRGFVRGEEI